MRSLVLALLLVAAPAMAQAPGFIGTWGLGPENCPEKNPDGDGIMVLETKKSIYYESGCDHTNIKAEPTGWTVKMSCEGEGEKFKETVHWSIDENGKLVQFKNGFKSVWTRCQKPWKR